MFKKNPKNKKGEKPEGEIEEVKEPLKMKRGDYQVHIFLEETRGLVPDEEG